jgi:uncharacterized membrane protein (UPF0127 family)
VAACGNDDGDEDAASETTESTATLPTTDTTGTTDTASDDGEATELPAAAGDALAAQGAEVTEPPGDPERVPLEGFGETAIAIEAADGTVAGHCVLLAATSAQRQRGLMEVTDLGGYTGMLFAFPEDSNSGFFMLNTPMPLSIAWFDAEGALVSTADMEPLDAGTTHTPRGSYRFALEVPQGDLAELGVDEASRLTAGGPCADRS